MYYVLSSLCVGLIPDSRFEYNDYSLVNHLIDKRIVFLIQVKSYFSW